MPGNSRNLWAIISVHLASEVGCLQARAFAGFYRIFFVSGGDQSVFRAGRTRNKSTGMQFFQMKYSFVHPRSGRPLLLLLFVLIFHSRQPVVNKVMEYDKTFTGISALFIYLWYILLRYILFLSINKELNVRCEVVSFYLNYTMLNFG